jgi:peptidoglycan hydrolase CwlO-like protein
MKHRTPFRAVFSALLAILLLLPQAAPARAASSSEIKGEIADLKKENSAIQAEINAIRKLYNANASEMQAIVDAKDAIDQEIVLLNQQIINVNEQIGAYGQLIADTQEELDVAQGLLDELSEQNRLRIRAMEEEGSISYWEVLFQANSFTDLLDRLNMVEEIAAADRRRLEEMRLAAEMVERTREDLNAGLSELQVARDELALTQQILEERRDDSDDLLRQLIEKQDEFQILLDESEAAQDDLMREIAAKEANGERVK